jgi:KDO2-lipid IV(A) lauroyltransferase
MPRGLIDFSLGGVFFIAPFFLEKIKLICIKNLHILYGNSRNDREYRQITDKYIRLIGHSMVDLLYYLNHPKELSKIVHFENEDHLKKALEPGRGVIAVTAHLSNFPLMFVSLVQKGYKVNVVIRKMRDEDFSKFMYQQCDKWNINMIETSPRKEFLRRSLGALKHNELLFILLDEVVPQEGGVGVRFFNSDVSRAPGPMLFMERTGSPVLPMFIAQEENKDFRIFIEKPFEIQAGGTKEENTVKNISGLTNIIESYVRRYPLQWGGWLNKRWAYG